MSVTIELPPEMETLLRMKAAEQGVSLAAYVSRVVEQAVPLAQRPMLSPAERAAAWRASAKDLRRTPPLSDEAICRETMYDTR